MYKYPTHEEALDFIEKISKIGWPVYKGRKKLEKYLIDNENIINTLGKDWPQFLIRPRDKFPFDFKFFRARKADKIKTEHLPRIKTYSCPPSYLVTENSRANLIGKPVFYASEHPVGSLLETIQQWEDPTTYSGEYVVSSWQLKEGRHYIAPFLPISIKNRHSYSVLGQYVNDQYRKALGENITDDEIKGLQEIQEYFSNLFIGTGRGSISSYISYKFLYENQGHPCIFIYPSVKTDYTMANFALHPKFVKENLVLSHVYRIKISSIKGNVLDGLHSQHSMYEFGIVKNKKVNWVPIDDIRQPFSQIYKKEWGWEYH